MDKVQTSFGTKVKNALFTPKFSIRNVVLSLILGFAVAYVTVLAIYGANDANAIVSSLFKGGFTDSKTIARLLDKIVILGFAGLSVGFGMKAGLLNIGVSGQMSFSAFVAYLIIRKAEITDTAQILILGFIITVVVATLISMLSGFLKAFFKVNEVISTIMMNWVVVYLLRYFAGAATGGASSFGGNITKDQIDLNGSFGNGTASNLVVNDTLWNTWYLAIIGISLFVFTALVLWFVISKTSYGFKLQAVGKSETAAQYSGYSQKMHQVAAFGISGMLAGMAGFAMFFLSTNLISAGAAPINEGFFGIAVALVGMNNPIGILGSAMVLGLLNGPTDGIILWGLPSNLIDIFTGIITYFVAISTLWMYLRPIHKYKLYKERKLANNQIGGVA